MKKFIAFSTAVFMLFSTCFAYNPKEVQTETAKYILSAANNPTISSIGGEWAVIGLVRAEAANSGYFEKYLKNAEEYIKENQGVLHNIKYTEYSRVILALSAIGKDPENIGGYNLLLPLGDYEKTLKQGLNGAIWALIAINSKGYDIPINPSAKVQATKELYLEKILSSQNPDGGWALSKGSKSDADITAMALCALSFYKDDDEIASAIDGALSYLSSIQSENGGFELGGVETAETCAQVLTALCALEISENDSQFVKGGKTVCDALLDFYNQDGSFSHIKGEKANQMATEQAFYALCALDRFNEGKTFLYDMSDIKTRQENDKNEGKETLTETEKDFSYLSAMIKSAAKLQDNGESLLLYYGPIFQKAVK